MTEKQLDLPDTSTTDHIQLSDAEHSFRLFHSVEELSTDWETAQPRQNLFLHLPFLTALESSPPENLRFCYLVFYKKFQPMGVALGQVANFKTDQSVQDMESGSKAPSFLRSFGVSLKNFVARQFEFNLLVCGNLLLTGEHGFYFDTEKIGRKKSILLLEEALKLTQVKLREKNIKTDGIFIKDIDESVDSCNSQLKGQSFREFIFHPNMVLYLRPEWQTFDDYLQSISSKYRVRVKKALKLGQPFEKVDFSEQQLETHKSHLYELYRRVMDNAGFNMVVLDENYIVSLKRHLGDKFKVTGYYLDGDLVGYRTNIHNFHENEAHFLGYDDSLNRSHKLYMNMLLDSLKQGIEQQVARLVYARTAMEIKSSIGAVPEDLFCYIRANSGLVNRIISPLLEYFRPPDDWVQRHPFKD